MKVTRFWTLLSILPVLIFLTACPSRNTSSEDRIATSVAEERAVAATLTSEAARAATNPEGEETAQAATATTTPTKVVVALSPTDTPTQIVAVPIPATAEAPTPTSTPTQIVAASLPVPGASNLVRSTDPTNDGLNILLPGFAPNEITSPMIFRDRIGIALSIYSVNASSQIAGAGVRQVAFTVRDLETDEIVYEQVESSSLYCLFGGNTIEECMPKTFAELNYQWPNGKPIYNGEYEVDMFIETDDDEGNWNPTIAIQGALDRSGQAGGSFGGSWQTNAGTIDFQQSGNQVSGTYQTFGDSQRYTIDGTVTGTVTGTVLDGTYSGYGGGTIRFELSQDGQRFDGSWFSQSQGPANHWCGVRSGPLWDGCGYSGSWESIGDYQPDYQPTIQLVQTGARVRGTFLNGLQNDPGTIDGQVGTEGIGSQLTAVGRWTVGGAAGNFRWRLADLQSDQMTGRSVTADGQSHQWCSWRPGLHQPSPCFE